MFGFDSLFVCKVKITVTVVFELTSKKNAVSNHHGILERYFTNDENKMEITFAIFVFAYFSTNNNQK